MTATSPHGNRAVPRSIAGVLQELELDQPRVVTREHLELLTSKTESTASASVAARLLRERGWLLPLRTSGTWEFAPGARAGAYGAGDPFIELRARLATRPGPLAVAAESAAWLQGLAGRTPHPHVLGLPPGDRLPRALDDFRAVAWVPATDTDDIDGLPVWSVSTLLAFMASRVDHFHDWPNVSEWLSEAAERASVDALRRELEGWPRSCWARAAYLLFRGRAAGAMELMSTAPEGRGPFHLGPRDQPSLYERRFEVVDHILSWSWSIKAPRDHH